MTIAECIKNLRIENNMTQQQLADILFTSQDTISLWERNKSYPDVIDVIKMSKIFNVSTDYILCVDSFDKNKS